MDPLTFSDTFVRTSGKCPNATIIRTIDECNKAAIAIGWSDTTAEDDGQSAVYYDPLGCYFESGSLKFNNNGNSGQCTSRDKCICNPNSACSTIKNNVSFCGSGKEYDATKASNICSSLSCNSESLTDTTACCTM